MVADWFHLREIAALCLPKTSELVTAAATPHPSHSLRHRTFCTLAYV